LSRKQEDINMAQATHQPGVCNIGPAEIRVRKMTAVIGFILTFALFIILRIIKAPQGLYSLEIFPATLLTTGWIQARSRFCIYFGMRGLFNFGGLGKSSSTETIDDAAFRAADRALALKLLARAVVLALPITAILILIS
jgi:hypothetical protein